MRMAEKDKLELAAVCGAGFAAVREAILPSWRILPPLVLRERMQQSLSSRKKIGECRCVVQSVQVFHKHSVSNLKDAANSFHGMFRFIAARNCARRVVLPCFSNPVSVRSFIDRALCASILHQSKLVGQSLLNS